MIVENDSILYSIHSIYKSAKEKTLSEWKNEWKIEK